MVPILANYLVNPRPPLFSSCRVIRSELFEMDERLYDPFSGRGGWVGLKPSNRSGVPTWQRRAEFRGRTSIISRWACPANKFVYQAKTGLQPFQTGSNGYKTIVNRFSRSPLAIAPSIRLPNRNGFRADYNSEINHNAPIVPNTHPSPEPDSSASETVPLRSETVFTGSVFIGTRGLLHQGGTKLLTSAAGGVGLL